MNGKCPDKGIILIVDDTPTNLGVLFDFLADSGFKILVARDGESALQKVEYARPDLILLDVLMPGIDGFETCRQLKAKELTKDIPVIFMTALSDPVDKLKGLKLGAVDYITKPLQHEEVLVRVNIHMSIGNLTKRLQEKNVLLQAEIEQRSLAEEALLQLTCQLEKRVEERTTELSQSNDRLKQEIQERLCAEKALQQSEIQLRTQTQWLEKAFRELQLTQTKLVQSERMSSLGQLVTGVAHEINNPVNFIYGNLIHANIYSQDLIELLQAYQQQFPKPGAAIEERIEAMDLEFMIDDMPKLLGSMKAGAERIHQIVQSLRIFSRLDEAEMKAVDIHDGLESTLLILHSRLKGKSDRAAIQILKEYGNLPLVECYAGQLNQVFMNLIVNAIDALEMGNWGLGIRDWELGIPQSPIPSSQSPLPAIRIRTEIKGDRLLVKIADNGPGMTEEVVKHIFDPFFTTKPVGKGTGMGLSISYEIVVQKHGGQLECFSIPGQGTEFVIDIPMRQQVLQTA